MKRKINIAVLSIVAVVLSISVVSAYTLDSYYLTKIGQYDVGTAEKTKYKYPTVEWTNGSTNSDAEIAVTLNKKNIIGNYGNVARQHKWIKNVKNYSFRFSSMSTATYRANIVFNATNDNAAISGQYYLTSAE